MGGRFDGWGMLRMSFFSNVDKKSHPDKEHPVRLCNYMDVYSNGYITSRINFMDATANEREIKKFSLVREDVLITKDSETPGDIAVSAVVDEDLDTVLCGYHLALIRPHKGISGRYLSHLFGLNLIQHYYYQVASGSTRFGLTTDAIIGSKLPFPPLPEQKKIAAILTSVDEVIEKTAAQISKLRDLKKAMMTELLTKGIGHTEFKGSPVGRIPATWEVKKLDQVAIVQTGIAKNKNISGELVEVPYLRVANVQDGFFDLSEVKTIRIPKEKLSRFLLKTHDILVNEGGDFDKLGRGNIWKGQVTPCVHQNHVFAVRVQQDILLPEFFNYVSGSDYGKKYYLGCAKQTTNLASINSSQLKMFQVILPPLSEQKKISQAIRTVDQKIKLIQQKLTQTKTLKKALMHDLLTGKKRVKVAVD